ncbi:MAG TPA: MauE/DoxX family redox-associated membrane protein, partial [Chloroflexota bacterium]
MDVIVLVARLLLAAVFALAGIGKLADRAGSRKAMRDFGVPKSFAGPGAVVLPVAELLVAVALIPDVTAWWGALGAGVLLLAFISGIARSMVRGETPDCHCFGQIHSEPAGWRTLLRNVVLLTITALVVSQGRSDAGWSALNRVGRLTDAEWVNISTALALLAAIAVLGWFMWRLLTAVNRLLERMDALDTRMAPAVGAQERTVREDVSEPAPAGPPAPAFALAGLDGERVTLDSLLARGKPLFLLFASTSCGSCTAALVDAGHCQAQFSARLTVVPIMEGTVDAARNKAAQMALANVLMQDPEVAAAYGAITMPSAVVVRSNGMLGSDVAVGPDAIGTLLESTVNSLYSSEIAAHEARIESPLPTPDSSVLASALVQPVSSESVASEIGLNGHASGDQALIQRESVATEPIGDSKMSAGQAPAADAGLLETIKRSDEYAILLRAQSDPILSDSWEEEGLHFFAFQLSSWEGAASASEPPSAVFVMRPQDEELVSAVVATPGNEQEPQVVDLRQAQASTAQEVQSPVTSGGDAERDEAILAHDSVSDEAPGASEPTGEISPATKPAPPFVLAGLGGESVSLHDLR